MLKHSKIRTTKTKKQIEKRKQVTDNAFKSSLLVISSFALFFAVVIIFYVIFKGVIGVGTSGIWDGGFWLFGDTYDSSVYFASGFMVINTIWTSLLATLIAVPISVLTALFITRIAPKSMRGIFFVMLSILAAIPSVIYGAFGAKALDLFVIAIFGTTSGSLLTIVITLAFMIIPTITLITTATINTVDKQLENSSLALGATKNQTSFYITLRAASVGILTGTILGVGRALGEATAVTMISVDPYGGPTFGLMNNIRLLTVTMLKGYNEMEPGSIQEASMFALGMLLILTILMVFGSFRILQNKNDPKTKAKKAHKQIDASKKIRADVENNGLENLAISKQKKYYKLLEKEKVEDEILAYYHQKYKKQSIIENTTIKSTSYDKTKSKKSKALGAFTWIMAFIGVLFLISIILFLLIMGTSALSWEGISVQLESAIFGTLLMIVLSMILIIPLGIGTGLYFSTFAKDNKLNKMLMSGIDILAGIPSLIFGLVGAALFLPFANSIGFTPLAGAFILTLIVIPTVVQTTKEAINSVPKQTISGSLALGGTESITSLKISLPKAMPQIISGVILSIGRIIGESAALIMVFGTVHRGSVGEWSELGGTTLATEMYRLTLMEDIPWDQVAAIGIIILIIILLLSIIANYISNKDNLYALVSFVFLILIFAGIFIGNETGLTITLLGIIGFIIVIFINVGAGIYNRGNR